MQNILYLPGYLVSCEKKRQAGKQALDPVRQKDRRREIDGIDSMHRHPADKEAYIMIVDPTTLRPIVNVDGQTCFGCGVHNPVGLHMEFYTDDRQVYSFLSIPAAMAGWDQTAHGGIVSTILDEIMGWSVIYLLRKIGVTKTMTVTFLKPVQVEQPLTVIGSIEEIVSEREVLVNGVLHGEDGAVYATSRATFVPMSAKTAVRLKVMSSPYLERFLPVLEQDWAT